MKKFQTTGIDTIFSEMSSIPQMLEMCSAVDVLLNFTAAIKPECQLC